MTILNSCLVRACEEASASAAKPGTKCTPLTMIAIRHAASQVTSFGFVKCTWFRNILDIDTIHMYCIAYYHTMSCVFIVVFQNSTTEEAMHEM